MTDAAHFAAVTGARITQERPLAWAETDAAGHNHFSVALRWLEEAEHLLWHSIGMLDMVPLVPRVHVEVDYRHRVYFGDIVTVRLGVVQVGTSSLTFAWDAHGPSGLVMEGRHVVVHAPDGAGSAPWPEAVRAALAASD